MSQYLIYMSNKKEMILEDGTSKPEDTQLILPKNKIEEFIKCFNNNHIFWNKDGTSFWANKDEIRYMAITKVPEENPDEPAE